MLYSRTCLKRQLSIDHKLIFKTIYRLMQVKSIAKCSKHSAILSTFIKLPNAGQKYCRMLPLEHSAILSTFIKLPLVIKIFLLSIFEWSLKTGSTARLCMYLFSIYTYSVQQTRCSHCADMQGYILTYYPSLVLVQPRKTSPCLTERLLMGRRESNQTSKHIC